MYSISCPYPSSTSYRFVVRKNVPKLHYIVSDARSTAIECVLSEAKECSNVEDKNHKITIEPRVVARVDPNFNKKVWSWCKGRGRLDLCFEFCISLLDRSLNGSVCDSLCGGLAVLGINIASSGFEELVTYNV